MGSSPGGKTRVYTKYDFRLYFDGVKMANSANTLCWRYLRRQMAATWK